VVAIEHHSDVCILDDLGECNRIVLALRRWTRASGLDDWALYSTTPWELLATLDDGRMLVIGSPVEIDGPTYTGEQPEPRVLLLSEAGEIQAELPALHGGLTVRQVFVLAADRVLFHHRNEWDYGSMLVAGVLGIVGMGNQNVVSMKAWVDGRGTRVAFVVENSSGHRLNYGVPPTF
jgi:hypothetical protein